MRAFLVLTEAEPRIVATPREAVTDGRLAENLSRTGIDRFIAHEIPVGWLRDMYGVPFEVIEAEVMNGEDLRVLDSNGCDVLAHVQFADLGPGFAHDL
jgi:predicted 3-demethylubiquinone-9 3-methyltransferase (glyoxalase superfamily)